MKKTINKKVDNEINRILDELSTCETDTVCYKELTERLDKLYEMRKKQTNAVWDRVTKIGLGILEVGVPVVATVGLFYAGLKFEETGTFTSTLMKGLINKSNKL